MNYFGSLLNERVVTDFVALIRTNIGSFEAGLQVQESLLALYYNVNCSLGRMFARNKNAR